LRIAIATWSRRKAGGVESYLSRIIPELHRVGHRVALLHEVDEPANLEQVALPRGAQAWSVADVGVERALARLREWGPDLIYSHGLHDTGLEERVIEAAPTVFFAHAYYGTCISGSKAFKRPAVTPCDRRFGWQCLLEYYPRRCGGLNPVTMITQYRVQSKRLKLLSGCKAIVTNSDHIRDEYLRHGIGRDRVSKVSLPVTASPARVLHAAGVGEPRAAQSEAFGLKDSGADDSEWRLLFLGRMDLLKGGRIFLDALPQVASSLDRPVRVTFAGDGPSREAWERKAAQVKTGSGRLTIEFAGWVEGSEVESLLAACDLLVLPSLWPEPFGLAGIEAGLQGVPSVAFAVGGINDWLIEGVNGHLAPGNPPTEAGLAEAIVKCLRDLDYHTRLRQGAVEVALRFGMESHLSALLKVFEGVAGAAPGAAN
jgi:glycosyltransferase involved in cell wall biosynthesis